MPFEIVSSVKAPSTRFALMFPDFTYFLGFHSDLVPAKSPRCVKQLVAVVTGQRLFQARLVLMSLGNVPLQMLPPMVTAIALNTLELFDALVPLDVNPQTVRAAER